MFWDIIFGNDFNKQHQAIIGIRDLSVYCDDDFRERLQFFATVSAPDQSQQNTKFELRSKGHEWLLPMQSECVLATESGITVHMGRNVQLA